MRDNEPILKVEGTQEHSDSLVKAYVDEISKMDIAERLEDTTSMSKEEAAMFDSLNREGDRVIYPSIDKLLNIVDSKYELVHIAARRSKEMTLTGHFQMPINKYVSKKNIGRALEEVAEGYIKVRKNETE